MNEYDVLIIGGGQAGIPLARRLAKEGRRVALAERRHLGGSCVNFGCTPTKAVLASARVVRLARRAAEFGIDVPTVTPDFAAVMRRARQIVTDSVASLGRGLDKAGVVTLPGHARFAGRDGDRFRVSVGDEAVTAGRVVIDTGTRTTLPPIDGLDRVPYLHAGNWLAGDVAPRRLAIVGAGYIGLEMAQFYRMMGADVVVIGSAAQVAGREDRDVADALRTLLEADGIRFILDARVKAVRKGADGELELTIDHGGHTETVAATDLFLATGRTPNTDDLGLDTIGLVPGKGGVLDVDERLATHVPGVWAAGDVRGGPMFTHSSWDDHRVLESQLLGNGKRTTAGRIVPYAIFTEPELGRVGMTETQAREKFGDAIKVARFEMNHNGRAVQGGESAGFIKLVADPETHRLLGASVLATEGAELVGSYITLMNADATLEGICRAIYIHPTLTEAVQSAASVLELGLDEADA